MASHIDDLDLLEELLVPIGTPIYKILETAKNEKGRSLLHMLSSFLLLSLMYSHYDFSYFPADPNQLLVDTATGVQELVKDKVGPTRFFAVYNQIREGGLKAKQARKQQLAFQAAVDPDSAIKRKQRKHTKQKLSKKRKIESYKGEYTGNIVLKVNGGALHREE